MAADETYPKMYFVLNDDLKMGKGKMCGQIGHATAMLTRVLEKQPTDEYKIWLDRNEPKIVLKAPESTLKALQREFVTKSNSSSFLVVSVHDAGKTQIAAGSLTVVGFSPLWDAKKPDTLKSLKLL